MGLQENIIKILKEDLNKKVEKMTKIVGLFINELYPNFNENDVKIDVFDDDVNYIETYYDPVTQFFFARYDDRLRELILNTEILETLEGYFGDDMEYVIDWFNNEFGTNVEYISS